MYQITKIEEEKYYLKKKKEYNQQHFGRSTDKHMNNTSFRLSWSTSNYWIVIKIAQRLKKRKICGTGWSGKIA